MIFLPPISTLASRFIIIISLLYIYSDPCPSLSMLHPWKNHNPDKIVLHDFSCSSLSASTQLNTIGEAHHRAAWSYFQFMTTNLNCSLGQHSNRSVYAWFTYSPALLLLWAELSVLHLRSAPPMWIKSYALSSDFSPLQTKLMFSFS